MGPCSACDGRGERTIRFGLPGQSVRIDGELVAQGEGWQQFKGGGYSTRHVVWGERLPPMWCAACQGTGERRVKDNPVAGFRIHLDADGMVVDKQAIGET